MKHLLNLIQNKRGEGEILVFVVLPILIFILFLTAISVLHMRYDNLKACKQITVTDLQTNEEVSYYGKEVREESEGTIHYKDAFGIRQILSSGYAKISIQKVDPSYCTPTDQEDANIEKQTESEFQDTQSLIVPDDESTHTDIHTYKKISLIDPVTNNSIDFYGSNVSLIDSTITFLDPIGKSQTLVPFNAEVSIQEVDSSFCITQPESQSIPESVPTEVSGSDQSKLESFIDPSGILLSRR